MTKSNQFKTVPVYDVAASSRYIRSVLVEQFPDVKFSVKSRRNAVPADATKCGDIIDVRWLDGPTADQVYNIVKYFHGWVPDPKTSTRWVEHHAIAQFEGRDQPVHFRVRAIIGHRTFSDCAYLDAAKKLAAEFDVDPERVRLVNNDDRPRPWVLPELGLPNGKDLNSAVRATLKMTDLRPMVEPETPALGANQQHKPIGLFMIKPVQRPAFGIAHVDIKFSRVTKDIVRDLIRAATEKFGSPTTCTINGGRRFGFADVTQAEAFIAYLCTSVDFPTVQRLEA